MEHGAKMVPFAGYSMPVQYKSGLVKEHLHCRSAAAIFDVSHMLQSRIYGKDRVKFIESLTVGEYTCKTVGSSLDRRLLHCEFLICNRVENICLSVKRL